MTGETYSLRSKEDAEDYRYMPDSNLPALAIAPVSVSRAPLKLTYRPSSSPSAPPSPSYHGRRCLV